MAESPYSLCGHNSCETPAPSLPSNWMPTASNTIYHTWPNNILHFQLNNCNEQKQTIFVILYFSFVRLTKFLRRNCDECDVVRFDSLARRLPGIEMNRNDLILLTGINMDQFQWNIEAANALPIFGTTIWPDFDTPAHFCQTANRKHWKRLKNSIY